MGKLGVGKIKEKLLFEHVFYDVENRNLTVYLMNCGRIDDTTVSSVSLTNETWERIFYEVQLRSLNDQLIQEFDVSDEGYLRLSVGLVENTSYTILMITGRGKAFVTSFVA